MNNCILIRVWVVLSTVILVVFIGTLVKGKFIMYIYVMNLLKYMLMLFSGIMSSVEAQKCDTVLDEYSNCVTDNCELWYDGNRLCKYSNNELFCPPH